MASDVDSHDARRGGAVFQVVRTEGDDVAGRVSPGVDVRGLFVEHALDLHRYAARRVGRDVADDVVAETFHQALVSAGSFDGSRGSARGWLFGIATNLLRRHWRVEQRRLRALARSSVSVSDDGADPLLRVPDRLDAESEANNVLDAVALLDTQDRDLLVLVAWEHLSSAEVAEVLGVPPGTIRSRLHRIRRHLDLARSPGHGLEGHDQ